MRRIRRNVAICLLAAGSTLSLVGCMKEEAAPLASEEEPSAGEPSDEVFIEIVELGFTDVLSDGSSPAPPEADTGEEAVGASAIEAVAAEEGEGEGEALDEEGEELPEPRQGTIMVKYLVEYLGQDQAPEGVDVEWVQKDADGNEKKRYADRVVTDGLGPGVRQVDVTQFEVDGYEDGDEFAVEWSSFVPAETRSENRE